MMQSTLSSSGRPGPRRLPGAGRRRALRRVLLGVSACAAALTAVAALPAAAAPGAPPPVRDEDRAGDHLTVTVRHAGAAHDGTWELYCHPEGGTHPDVRGACALLDRSARWGRDLFAPVPQGSACTMQYGGPATARVTGVWAGRRVDAAYDRRNGCEIDRWNQLVPLLPDLRS